MRKVVYLGVVILTVLFLWKPIISIVTGMPQSCLDDFDSNKIGLTQNSLTIGESKEKGVFVCELIPSQVAIEPGLKLNHIWIEKLWSYECLETELTVVPKEAYQLLIETPHYSSFEKEFFSLDGKRLEVNGHQAGANRGVIGFRIENPSRDPLFLEVKDKNNQVIERIELKR